MSLLQFINDLNDAGLDDVAKHGSFRTFLTYFDGLKTAVLNNRNITDQQLSGQIFKRKWKENQADNIFKNHLFAAYNTLHRLDARITAVNFGQYNPLIKMLAFDLYRIIAHAEYHYRNTELNYDMGSRPHQIAREIFDISCQIIDLNLNALYPRELIPVSIFLLRQTIEVYGKQTIGYYSITDEDENRIVNINPQIAWEFIKKETLSPQCRITLPVNIDIILKVEEWTNAYVHTGNIPEIFIIENALEFITPLIYPTNRTPDYLRRARISGTTQIRNYNSIKTDFEAFVNKRKFSNIYFRIRSWILITLKIKKPPKIMIVNWLEQPEATILSL